MATDNESMVQPPVEGLLDRAGSKFHLVTAASQRARQINSYFGQLGDGLGKMVPPQVTSTARKPLSIAFQEIDADKIVPVHGSASEEEPAAAPAAAAAETSEADGSDAS